MYITTLFIFRINKNNLQFVTFFILHFPFTICPIFSLLFLLTSLFHYCFIIISVLSLQFSSSISAYLDFQTRLIFRMCLRFWILLNTNKISIFII